MRDFSYGELCDVETSKGLESQRQEQWSIGRLAISEELRYQTVKLRGVASFDCSFIATQPINSGGLAMFAV